MCHPKTLDVASLIREQKIILMSLESQARRYPTARPAAVGRGIDRQHSKAVMGHAAARARFALYVDEAEDFVTTSLPEMIAQARFANLSLILANQYLKQLAGTRWKQSWRMSGQSSHFSATSRTPERLLPYMRP